MPCLLFVLVTCVTYGRGPTLSRDVTRSDTKYINTGLKRSADTQITHGSRFLKPEIWNKCAIKWTVWQPFRSRMTGSCNILYLGYFYPFVELPFPRTNHRLARSGSLNDDMPIPDWLRAIQKWVDVMFSVCLRLIKHSNFICFNLAKLYKQTDTQLHLILPRIEFIPGILQII